MNMDQDRLLLIRADLSDKLELLRLTSFDHNPMQFLLRLENLRQSAITHGFDAVAEIASVFEVTIERVIQHGGSDSVIGSFTGILNDAIGCKQMSASATQALLASVAVRRAA